MDKNLSSDKNKIVDVGGTVERESWRKVATKLYSDVLDLIDKEGRPIREEMSEKVNQMKVATFSLITSALILLIGAQCLAATAIILLSKVMPLWLSGITVTAAFFTIGGVFYTVAKSKIKERDYRPKKSLDVFDQVRYSLRDKVDEISRH
jgi:hypothetical protein